MKNWITTFLRAIQTRLNPLLKAVIDFENKILKWLAGHFAFLAPLKSIFKKLFTVIKLSARLVVVSVVILIPIVAILLGMGKIYQHLDQHKDRGAIGINEGKFNESYVTPVYVDQGWDKADSLWFYNTTQGSNLLPYDIFVSLEQADNTELFIDIKNIDRFRYLPQQPTRFNPDGLPVGFVKDTYIDKDYVGLTCAGCHTGQINYCPKIDGKKTDPCQAIRVDGAPAMANIDLFLGNLARAMQATVRDEDKNKRLADRVMARNGFSRWLFGGRDYVSADQVTEDLQKWANRIEIYNTMNKSPVEYGYARLDAFGRIYNRVLEHVLNGRDVRNKLPFVIYPSGSPKEGDRVITDNQIDNILKDICEKDEPSEDSTGKCGLLGLDAVETIITRLELAKPDYPALDYDEILLVRDALFNKANAPVSYPFLWDIAQSDYVQWNGLASNAGVGPLGRNTGEVIGVFATLDWKQKTLSWWDKLSLSGLAAEISGQSLKRPVIDFKSSVDKVNLTRLEAQLKSLRSPLWEEVVFEDGSGLPEFDQDLVENGQALYAEYCQSCHEIIKRDAWDRKVTGKMISVKKVATDPVMADNSVNYKGQAGNFKNIYQATSAGTVIVEGTAPVVQILTAATRGVIGTPDADKIWPRRVADWFYSLGVSLFTNNIKASVKSGDYEPDTTANPYASLNSYKARSLNGIWATAPYLHNGSVPTLYDLLLPQCREKSAENVMCNGDFRPEKFRVGCRELDVKKVGFTCKDAQLEPFDVFLEGNSNSGHQYAAGKTIPLGRDKALPALDKDQRLALVEYLKTL